MNAARPAFVVSRESCCGVDRPPGQPPDHEEGSQPVSWAQPPMRGESASRGGRGGVAIHYLAAAPSGESHQVAFRTTIREPVVREGVAELMRVQVLEARPPRSSPRDLAEAARRERPTGPEPKEFDVSFGMAATDAEITVDRLRRAITNPNVARSTPLRLREEKGQLVEIDVFDAKPGNLRQPRSCVDEDAKDCSVSAIIEARALASPEQVPQLIVAEHRRWRLRNLGRRHVPHGRRHDFAFLNAEAKKALQCPVAVRGRRRLPSMKQILNEGLEVFAGDRVDGGRHPAVGEEPS